MLVLSAGLAGGVDFLREHNENYASLCTHRMNISQSYSQTYRNSQIHNLPAYCDLVCSKPSSCDRSETQANAPSLLSCHRDGRTRMRRTGQRSKSRHEGTELKNRGTRVRQHAPLYSSSDPYSSKSQPLGAEP